jgi:hypothetical protein
VTSRLLEVEVSLPHVVGQQTAQPRGDRRPGHRADGGAPPVEALERRVSDLRLPDPDRGLDDVGRGEQRDERRRRRVATLPQHQQVRERLRGARVTELQPAERPAGVLGGRAQTLGRGSLERLAGLRLALLGRAPHRRDARQEDQDVAAVGLLAGLDRQAQRSSAFAAARA